MSYPNIKDPDFTKKINKKYNKYTIPTKKKTFNQICFPKDFQLQAPQQFLAKYINPKTNYKGVLVFHKIGAGKTCTAVNIAEQWKGNRKIIVVVPASLIGNFRNELRSLCAGNAYLTASERTILEGLHPSKREYKDIISRSDKRIDKYYQIYSYNKFVEDYNDGNINLYNSILIVDEVQNMVSEEGIYYKTLYDAIHKAPSNLRIVLLSATPIFDKPIEIALTMNLLRIPVEFPTGREFEKMFIDVKKVRDTLIYSMKNVELFKDMVKGYVSYFGGADKISFPEMNLKWKKVNMSSFQYKSYLAVLRSEEKKQGLDIKRQFKAFEKGGIKNLPSTFMLGERIVSNIAFPNKNINEKGFKSFEGNHLKFGNLEKYSIKFYNMLRAIKRSKGPVFIYSGFLGFGGITSFIKVLEYHGYSSYNQYGEGSKRYCVWSGDQKLAVREEIKQVFNQPNNTNGSKIKVFIGSPSSREGLSLLSVKTILVMEPYWNYSRILQIIGRGIRYCSHKRLPPEDRTVNVYIYIATHPNEEETIDQYIYKMAMKKNRLIQQFEKALKEAAIDCTLFKNANVYPGEEPIKCIL